MQLTVLERDCHMYATFQSHNQKVVQNRNGVFLSYLSRYDESAERGRWVLAQSSDGGATFRERYSMDIVGAKPPAIETDAEGTLLLAGEDGSEPRHGLYYSRFLAKDDYHQPVETTRLPCGSRSKFAMDYDRVTGTLYFFNHYGGLYVIDAVTGKHRLIQVMEPYSEIAQTQYPHVYLDLDRVLHHAWTTQHKNKYLYWDIHYAQSADRGETWTKADGTPLPIPFVPDDSGPSDPIILPDEFEVHTWLSSMIEKNGKAHFAYRAHNYDSGMNRQHYVRVDLKSGKIDLNVYPQWRVGGLSINSLDGFFATRRDDPASALYYVSRTEDRSLAAIVSLDNGDSWDVLDASDPMPPAKDTYSIGGSREVTSDGFIIGTFTMQEGKKGDPCFFRIAAQLEGLPEDETRW